MSKTSEAARKAMKEKAERMVRPATGKIDASSYDAPATFDPEKPTGKLPTTRRKFKDGGKVAGEHTTQRADRKVRVGPKRGHECDERAGKMIGGSLAYMSPALMAANALRDKDKDRAKGGRAKKAAGGANAGDTVPTSRMAFTGASGSRLSKALGLKKGGTAADGEIQGTRPTGGRRARKDGGRAGKGKVNVNIIIGAGKGEQAAPPHPMPVPIPMPPPGMGPQGPAGPPPGLVAGPPPGLPPGMPPMGRKAGGRTYRSAKDMDAGSLGGLGRLEKTEIQKHRA